MCDDFAAQFGVDDVRTLLEDASIDRDDAVAPQVVLGGQKLDAGSPREALQGVVEGLSFDPWHAPVEIRPIGNMMWARNPADRHSTEERGAADELAVGDIPS